MKTVRIISNVASVLVRPLEGIRYEHITSAPYGAIKGNRGYFKNIKSYKKISRSAWGIEAEEVEYGGYVRSKQTIYAFSTLEELESWQKENKTIKKEEKEAQYQKSIVRQITEEEENKKKTWELEVVYCDHGQPDYWTKYTISYEERQKILKEEREEGTYESILDDFCNNTEDLDVEEYDPDYIISDTSMWGEPFECATMEDLLD